MGDCRHVLHAEGFSSPFTYIIVDREGGTRTCIHTPGDPLRPEEISEELTNNLLQDARLVYLVASRKEQCESQPVPRRSEYRFWWRPNACAPSWTSCC